MADTYQDLLQQTPPWAIQSPENLYQPKQQLWNSPSSASVIDSTAWYPDGDYKLLTILEKL